MSFLARFVPNIFTPIQQTLKSIAGPSTIGAKSITETLSSQPGGLFSITSRTNIRVHFPRPSERKRIKRHGFAKRMKTESGQKILMNKILKGRHVLSH